MKTIKRIADALERIAHSLERLCGTPSKKNVTPIKVKTNGWTSEEEEHLRKCKEVNITYSTMVAKWPEKFPHRTERALQRHWHVMRQKKAINNG